MKPFFPCRVCYTELIDDVGRGDYRPIKFRKQDRMDATVSVRNLSLQQPGVDGGHRRITLIRGPEFLMCLHETVDPRFPGTRRHSPNNC